MTRKQEIIAAFQFYGYRITLGEALQHPWGYKFASRCSDLRREGCNIRCIRGKRPSDNIYVMRPPQENNGQLRMAL